jgi:hypothetical protein
VDGHQQLRLIGLQRLGRVDCFWPPGKFPFREPLLGQPVALAVISEESDRCPAAAAKHEHASGKRVLGELLPAQARQRIDALSSVHGLDGHQHAHLRGDLNHRSESRQARRRLVQFGAPRIPNWIGGGARSYGGNFGGGIKLFLHKNFFFRADLRDYITGKPYDLTYPDPAPGQGISTGGVLHLIEGTVGVGITF